jgi:hypothetical protein
MIPLPSLSDAIGPVEAAFEAVSHAERVNWMRALWKLCEGRTVAPADLHGGEGEIVIHEGQNSLPLFSQFQKRIVRRGDVIQGYNHQFWGWLTGPGHFLVKEADTPYPGAHFSYLEVARDVPDGFPPLRENTAGLSILVYAHMIDYLRKVSPHALIGRAYKKGKATGDYFMLVRA